MSVTIAVPATSANLGIGYDCLGMAVSLYSRFTFDRAEKLTITGCPETVSYTHLTLPTKRIV